jgi:hypothetical protein
MDAQGTSSIKKEDGLPAPTGEAATSNVPSVSKTWGPPQVLRPLVVSMFRPLCMDRDALAGMLIAGLLTADPARAATPGCQTLPADAKLQIVQRYPRRVSFHAYGGGEGNVSDKARPDAGFILEVDAPAIEGSSVKAPQ